MHQHDAIPWGPSSLDQHDIDEQLKIDPLNVHWDQISPADRQALVDARRMLEDCSVSFRRIEACERARMRRREREMREEQERRMPIDWDNVY